MAEMVKKVSIGEIQRSAQQVALDNSRLLLIYLVVFVPLTAISIGLDQSSGDALDIRNGPYGLLVGILSVVAQFFLFGRIFFPGGDVQGAAFGKIMGFLGLAIVSFLGVVFATVLLIVPGLIVGAKWLMAPSYYVAGRRTAMDALGASWERSAGNTGTIIGTVLIALIIIVLFSVLFGGASYYLGSLVGAGLFFETLVEALLNEIATLFLICLSVGTYKLLESDTEEMADVFL